MAVFTLDREQYERLVDVIQQFGDGAETAINNVLWNEGGELIRDKILELLPRSGRTWAGKKKAAKDAAPFSQRTGNLSVTVHTKGDYNYLYFPDDGENTRRHAGQQHFMLRGGEAASEKIINLCIGSLLDAFEEV